MSRNKRVPLVFRKVENGETDFSAPDIKTFLFHCYSMQVSTNIHMDVAHKRCVKVAAALPSMSLFGLTHAETEGLKKAARFYGRSFKVWRAEVMYSQKYKGSKTIVTFD